MTEMSLYHQLASAIIDQIRNDSFKPGEKLPSVRALAKQQKISVSTVLAAYGVLEDRGFVEVRPKSGYFVRRVLNKTPKAPSINQSTSHPQKVTTPQRVMEVMRDGSSQQFIAFSVAVPGRDFPVVHQLKRSFAKVVRNETFLGIGYDSPKGNQPLRRQLARRAMDAGILVSPDEIVTTSSCQSALGLCLRALTKAGDIVAVETPTYYGLLQLIEAMGLKAIEVPSDPHAGMNVGALKLALEQWPIKAILTIPCYSNPLGSLMPDDQKRELIDLIYHYDIPMIEDDIYGELGYEGTRPKAVKAYDHKGQVLLCSSVSKTLDPQLGVGWVIPGRYQEQIEYQKFLNSISIARLPQLAIGEMLAHGGYERHLRHARESYRQRRDRLTELLLEHFPSETRFTQPQGGFVSWIQLPPGTNALKLYLEARQEGILISPGELYSSAANKYQRSIRLCYADAWTPEREMAIKTLGELVSQQLEDHS
ncbi:MAG: PLP-dependent aminotransferase family protein [Chromatiales bacterium]|nr:PLP-dependent aminotransferase family protein [Chromatiales bacterium]